MEFESNLEGKMVQELPEGVSNGTGLVFLNQSDPMVDITGKLKYAGKYVFIVHYFQPLYPGEKALHLPYLLWVNSFIPDFTVIQGGKDNSFKYSFYIGLISILTASILVSDFVFLNNREWPGQAPGIPIALYFMYLSVFLYFSFRITLLRTLTSTLIEFVLFSMMMTHYISS